MQVSCSNSHVPLIVSGEPRRPVFGKACRWQEIDGGVTTLAGAAIGHRCCACSRAPVKNMTAAGNNAVYSALTIVATDIPAMGDGFGNTAGHIHIDRTLIRARFSSLHSYRSVLSFSGCVKNSSTERKVFSEYVRILPRKASQRVG